MYQQSQHRLDILRYDIQNKKLRDRESKYFYGNEGYT